MQYPNVMIIETSPDDNGTFRYGGFSADAANYMSQLFKFKCVSILNFEKKILINYKIT